MKREFLTIRVDKSTKHRFQALYYLLKSKGLVEYQEELINAIVDIWERYPEILKKVLRRDFR